MDAGSKNFAEGNTVSEKNKALTRTGIMLVLLPAVQSALGTIPGLDVTGSVAHLRRTVRALCTIAVRMLLDAGAPPQFVAQQLIESLGHELEERAAKQKAESLGASPIFPNGGPAQA